MTPRLLAGVAALSLLMAGGAHATELCGMVLKTSDGFLALREGPGVQSKVIAKLFPGNALYSTDDPTVFDDEAQFQCLKPMREFQTLKDARFCRSLWVRVSTDELTHSKLGWVNAKYVQLFPCKNPEHIRAPDVSEEEPKPPPVIEPQVTDEFRDDWCRRNNWDGQSASCQDKKSLPKWLLEK